MTALVPLIPTVMPVDWNMTRYGETRRKKGFKVKNRKGKTK